MNLLLNTFVALLFLFPFKVSADIYSETILEFIKNRKLVVDTKSSNSPGCENACTLEDYLKSQLKNISEDLDSVKIENFDPNKNQKAKFSNTCNKQKRPPAYQDFLKEKMSKMPRPGTYRVCKFELSYENGESVWSESLYYLKDKKTNQFIADSLWAFGTP